MLNIEIVNLKLEHIDDVMVVEHLCFKIPWSKDAFIQEVTTNKFARYVAAKAGNRVIGYAGLWKIFDEGHITNVAVHPEFRGQGVGWLLIERLIEISRAEGVTSLTLEVRKSNTVAQSLYSRHGFVEEGIRKAYYADNGEDAIIMWKHGI